MKFNNYVGELEEGYGFIYIIWNTVSNKCYLGQCTTALDVRWGWHIKKLNDGTHENPHLLASWNKYGDEAFEFRWLCKAPISWLDWLEKDYIKKYDATNREHGFNVLSGGKRADRRKTIQKLKKGKQ